MPSHLGLRAGSIRLRRVTQTEGDGDLLTPTPSYRVVGRSGEWGGSAVLQ